MTDKIPARSTLVKSALVALAVPLWLGAAGMAQAQQPGGPGGPGHPGGPGMERHEQRDQHGPGGHYDFRDSDRDRLRKHYAGDMKHVDRGHRPDFRAGQPMPQDFRGRIKPVPASVRRGLPPPPRGYQMGYYGGYTVVYDPVSFTILQVLDILR